MWIYMALLSALFAAGRRVNEKRLSRHLHSLSLGWTIQLLSLPLIIVAMLVSRQWLDPLNLGLSFWLPLIAVCIGFYPLNNLLYFKAIKHGELSTVLPLQSLWPGMSLLPGLLFLHESITALSLAGILCTVIGVYALGLKGSSLHHPFKPFQEDKSSLYMLGAVSLVTAASILDKIAIKASNATFFSLMSTIGAVILLYGMSLVSKVRDSAPIKHNVRELALLGSMQGVSYTTYLIAMSLGPVAYVSAIRSSNILFGALLGILLLKERFTVQKKLSFVCITLGAALLAVTH